MTIPLEIERRIRQLDRKVSALEREPREPARKYLDARRYAGPGFTGPLWVIGGRDYEATNVYDDVFTGSATQWAIKTSAALFGQRSEHTSLVFGGKMWVIGGRDENGQKLSDIWYSFNGKFWILATAAAGFLPRYGHASCVHGGRMWVFGGWVDTGGSRYANDVWSSINGTLWTEVNANASWAKRVYHDVLSYRDQLFLIGGIDDTVTKPADPQADYN